MTYTKYINVISGKGGTGKTLLCTILAELLGNQNVSVLIIDMDIFVRGLTALLYFQKGESLRLIDEDEISVSDIFFKEKPHASDLGIHKYRSFDIAPAVTKINQIFNFKKEFILESNHNELSFIKLFEKIPKDKYDYVFFDCRAGYDSLVSAIHEHSDITICVQEDDDISEVTANNLIRQLELDTSQKTIYKLVNKTRNIKTFEELEKKQKNGLNSLGFIPFDMDVMNSFGEKSFWDDISKSLYKAAVAESWNKLVSKAELKHPLNFKRYSPLIQERIERTLSYLPLTDRLIGAMGLLLTIFGFTYSFFSEDIRLMFNNKPDKAISLLISLLGLLLFVYIFMKRKRH